MTKPNSVLLILGMITLICISFAFKPAPNKIAYQYITIIGQQHDLDEVSISIDGKDFVNSKLTRESHGHWDMNPILNIVHQYENDGYELISFTGTGQSHYFLLKKV